MAVFIRQKSPSGVEGVAIYPTTPDEEDGGRRIRRLRRVLAARAELLSKPVTPIRRPPRK